MNRKPFTIGNKSVEEKLNEISQEQINEKDLEKLQSNILEKAAPSSVLDSLNETIKIYKRVGFDLNAEIDDKVENVANNILRDKTSKKAIFNEIMEIGWPIWERKLNSYLENKRKI